MAYLWGLVCQTTHTYIQKSQDATLGSLNVSMCQHISQGHIKNAKRGGDID